VEPFVIDWVLVRSRAKKFTGCSVVRAYPNRERISFAKLLLDSESDPAKLNIVKLTFMAENLNMCLSFCDWAVDFHKPLRDDSLIFFIIEMFTGRKIDLETAYIIVKAKGLEKIRDTKRLEDLLETQNMVRALYETVLAL
jgi:hypothetical protein